MLKIIRFSYKDKDFHQKAVSIRKEVFVKEQKVPLELEIENEEDCTHYLLFDENTAIGTARWRKTETGIKLERFAIIREHRNADKGSFLLKKILKDVIPFETDIYLNSQVRAVSYYKRQGFEKVGETFEEAGIEHYKMIFSASTEPPKI